MPNRLLTDEEKLRAQLLDESGYVPDPEAQPVPMPNVDPAELGAVGEPVPMPDVKASDLGGADGDIDPGFARRVDGDIDPGIVRRSPRGLSPGKLSLPADLADLVKSATGGQPPAAAPQPAPAPAPAAEPDRDAKLAAAIAALGRQPERSPEDRKHAVTNRLIENLYLASVRKPLNFAPYEEDKAKNSDPLLGLKAQLLQARIAKAGQAPAAAAKTPKEQADLTAIKQAIISSRPDLVKAFGGGDENLGRERIMALNSLDELKSGSGIFNQALTNENADLSRALAEKNSNRVQKRFEMGDLNKLGEISEPFAGLQSSLREIDRLAPGILHGKVPDNFSLSAPETVLNALGKYTAGLTKRAMDPKSVALAGAVHNFMDQLIRLRSGKAITDQEYADYKNMLNTAALAGGDAMAQVLPMFRRELHNRMRARQASFYLNNPEAFDEWAKETGALTYKDPLFQERDAPAAAAAEAPPVDVQTQATEPTPEQLQALESAAPGSQIRVPPPAAAKPPAGAKVPMINRKTGERVRVLLQDVKDAIADGFEELTGG